MASAPPPSAAPGAAAPPTGPPDAVLEFRIRSIRGIREVLSDEQLNGLISFIILDLAPNAPPFDELHIMTARQFAGNLEPNMQGLDIAILQEIFEIYKDYVQDTQPQEQQGGRKKKNRKAKKTKSKKAKTSRKQTKSKTRRQH